MDTYLDTCRHQMNKTPTSISCYSLSGPEWLREFVINKSRIRRGISSFSFFGNTTINNNSSQKNPEIFLERLKDNPWLLTTDQEIQLAIRVLQGDCLTGSYEQAKHAKKLLRKAGISLFIPKKSKKRMTEDLNFKYLQSNPYLLVELVKMFKATLTRYLQSPYKNHHDLKSKTAREAIKKCYKDYIGKTMPKNFLYGERNKSLETIALGFVSEKKRIPFEALRDFYYKLPRVKHGKKSIIRINRTDKKVDLIYPF